MATKNRYITSNFTPAEPEEFKKWCKEKKIDIHSTGYGDDVYLTTNKSSLAYDEQLVRFTKHANIGLRTVMLCEIKFKGNFLMGCKFYKVDDSGITEMGNMSYLHNIERFLNAIMEQTK